MMIKKLINSAENNILINRFEFSKTYPGLLQAFSTRKGGISKTPFHGLNLGLHTIDDNNLVRMNRSIFFQQLHISERQVVFPAQVHSDNIVVVTNPGVVQECDALITNTKDVFLTIQTADCFPVFLFDPQKQTAAIIHSGWRGTAKNIAGKTVEIMIKEFHCSPEKIYAGIGPGVLQECYQVDRAAADFFGKDSLKPDGPDHFKLDIQGVIIKQLLEAGISIEHLEIENTCTYCAEDLYYSHRRDAEQSGRMMGVIGIRS